MKVFLLLVMLMSFSTFLYAQNRLALEDLSVNGKVAYGTSTEEFIKAMGEPDSTYSFFEEMNEITITSRIYGASAFQFYEEKLLFYYLRDSKHPIHYQELSFKVGDKIDELAKKFPYSYRAGSGEYMVFWFHDTNLIMVLYYDDSKVITKIAFKSAS